MQPLSWLALGWRDIHRAGIVSISHGLAIACAGAAIVAFAHHRFWLLAGALSGFLVIAPVLATSLYALSKTLEYEDAADWDVVAHTWLRWQDLRSHPEKRHYWRMVHFGILLGSAATLWVLTSAALITLFAASPVRSPADFVEYVLLAKDGWLFEVWLALGGILAAPMFASSVIAMPLLLDQQVSVKTAVLTSWRVVLENPVVMAWWAALIMGFTLLGLASLMLGLILVIPMLGHASWHAYRDLVFIHTGPSQGC
jgi:uncharacterized membrane protein